MALGKQEFSRQNRNDPNKAGRFTALLSLELLIYIPALKKSYLA